MELGIPDSWIDELVRMNMHPEQRGNENLPIGTRQILLVKSHCIFSSSYVQDSNGKTFAKSYLFLQGNPSPSSDRALKLAVIQFVNDSDPIRIPQYIAERGTIYLDMRISQMEGVLAQLHEPDLYCWIGHFEGGHIYGDIHTNDKNAKARKDE